MLVLGVVSFSSTSADNICLVNATITAIQIGRSGQISDGGGNNKGGDAAIVFRYKQDGITGAKYVHPNFNLDDPQGGAFLSLLKLALTTGANVDAWNIAGAGGDCNDINVLEVKAY